MLSSLTSESLKRLTLVPFFYAVATRFATRRDFLYLVASSWIPGIWILYRLGDHGLAGAALIYAAGYLCFISVYEFGYLVNDTWDAANDLAARRRIEFETDTNYLALFAVIRVCTWIGIAVLTGWIGNGIWLAAFAALVVVFAEHNLVKAPAFRSASFFQLSCLRFTIPVLGGIAASLIPIVLFISVVFYTYFRYLAYLDSKGQLEMPERQRPGFGLVQILMLAPIIVFVAYASGAWLMLEMLGYFVLVYGVYAVSGRD